jgi:dipeptidyl-peptidase-4
MPRYDRYEKLRREISGSVVRGQVTARWNADGTQFEYSFGGKTYLYDVSAKKAMEGALPPSRRTSGPVRRTPERGRQYDTVFSADGKQKATYRNGNIFLSQADGKDERPVTTQGDLAKRLKFGVATWVYGEELGVREAMWFSPDAKFLAYYGFDETPVRDYHLAYDQTKIYTTLDQEAYPKAGTPNPMVSLFVYDIATRETVRVDVAAGDASLAEYVYEVRWSPKGDELLFHRTNRKQNRMQFCAANPRTGQIRIILEESSPESWVENSPEIRWLSDGNRFLWASERNGFKNYYLYDLSGKLLNTVTRNAFDADRIVGIDEKRREVFYLARSGETPYLAQLHRVGLDGRGDRRLTDPKLSHTVDLAPGCATFLDVEQRRDIPPRTVLRDRDGRQLAVIVESDLTKFEALGLKKLETIKFLAADGKTECWGDLQFPSDFDPTKKYPLVVSVYGGPESGGAPERFETPDPITEFGFIVARFDGRGTNGRGKAFKSAVYGKLGVVEIDDQAAGVKSLASRPYIDLSRVGIHGTSYGGYATIMALLRHPDVFHVGGASSSVTDWRNYDTIYTERYMGLPSAEDNLKGYEEGSAMAYVANLKGRLHLYFGTADNNVHPSNTLQLIQALDRAGKTHEQSVGPDRGHTMMDFRRLWELMIDGLILQPRDALKTAWRARSGQGTR